MDTIEVQGDLLKQNVDVIVNAWNRNIIPWWLLLPQGVSGAIKKYGGTSPFKELSIMGSIPLGGARVTSAGKLPYKSIIHVAGINMFWFATEFSVRESVRNAMEIVNRREWKSVAFPLIGSGSGYRGGKWSKDIMKNEFSKIDSHAIVYLVEYKETAKDNVPEPASADR